MFTRIKRGQNGYQSRGLPLGCVGRVFLYFQSGFFCKSAKNYSATYKRKKLAFFLKLALYFGFLLPGMSMPCMLTQYMPAHCTAMPCMATSCKPHHARPHQARPRHARQCSVLNALCKNWQRHANRRYRAKTGLTAACQLICFKFNTTAKVGMSLKINSVMPTTAKE